MLEYRLLALGSSWTSHVSARAAHLAEYPLLALSGHNWRLGKCPFSGVKRTSLTHAEMSAFDPKRTLTTLRSIVASTAYQLAAPVVLGTDR